MQNRTPIWPIEASAKVEQLRIRYRLGLMTEMYVAQTHFTARRYASAVLPSLCVRLYVRPSVRHTPVLYQNGQTYGSRKQRHTIAHGLYGFLVPKNSNSKGSPNGDAKCRRD